MGIDLGIDIYLGFDINLGLDIYLEMDIIFGLDIYLGMAIDLDGHRFGIGQWLGNEYWFVIGHIVGAGH